MSRTLNAARAGDVVYTAFSGVGVDTLIVGGPGKLNQIVTWDTYPLASGGGVMFYDSAVATSGGPFGTSGHQFLGCIFPYTSGSANIGTPVGQPVVFDMPFANGLVAAPIGGSGGPAFAVSYTSGVYP